jgi:hypothetical protein
MRTFLDFIAKLPTMSVEQLMGLISLTALGLAIFTVYVVFAVVTRGGPQ